MKNYDYIIAGTGAAGLTLAVRMIDANLHQGKRILLLDREEKTTNDRTWCFWEAQPDRFEYIIYHRWAQLLFYGDAAGQDLQVAPFVYKMIRSKIFYAECRRIIRQHPEFEWVQAEVQSISNTPDERTLVCTDIGTFSADYTFSSLFQLQQLPKQKDDISLLQHFKGWFIRTEKPTFDPNQAVFMDFRVSQQHGTTFVYVLPLSEHTALVEYTLFTARLLEKSEYDTALKEYIDDYLDLEQYTIQEEEFGIIPMTDHVFPEVVGNIINIGTAGGYTKASSGYTFRNIQQRTARLVTQMQQGIAPNRARTRSHWRFPWYDTILLYVLAKKKMRGKDAFRQLFAEAPPKRVLEFLDEATSLRQDLPILMSLPTWTFMKAALAVIARAVSCRDTLKLLHAKLLQLF